VDNQDNIEQSGCNMLKIILILGGFAVTANVLFILYAKKRSHNTKPDKPATFTKDSSSDTNGFLYSEEGKKLKQSAATELGISVEELDRLTVEEITDLAKINELIE